MMNKKPVKTALLFATILGSLAFTASSQAGPRVNVFFNAGGGYGCGPRYYASPVYYVPRQTYYCPPRVASYRPSPVYFAPAPVIYVPAPRIYRAPVVSTVSFGWRR